MHGGSHDRLFAVRPIALTHAPSSDHLTTRTMLSLHHATLALVAQPGHKTYRKIYYISLHTTPGHNARLLAPQNVRFFHAKIYKTDCEFLRSHGILVASDRATIVKGPL